MTFITDCITTEYRPALRCWLAFEGDENQARWIGEGSTPEDALSDYWAQRHPDGRSCHLAAPGDDGWWKLVDGARGVERLFRSKSEATGWANRNHWRL